MYLVVHEAPDTFRPLAFCSSEKKAVEALSHFVHSIHTAGIDSIRTYTVEVDPFIRYVDYHSSVIALMRYYEWLFSEDNCFEDGQEQWDALYAETERYNEYIRGRRYRHVGPLRYYS